MTMTADDQKSMLLSALSPFYVTEKLFPSKTTDYACVVCNTPVKTDDVTVTTPAVTNVSVSYTTTPRGVWAHTSCLTTAGIASSTEWRKRQAAHSRVRRLEIERKAVEKAGLVSATTAPDTDALRADIAAEYETRMQQAITVIRKIQAERDGYKALATACQERVAVLESALAVLDDAADDRQIAANVAA